ncbi:hypothetical protein V2O64_11235 [Verrucomicrobiaceae bacterium 227]
MKNFLLLLFALAILVVFGGSAYFLSDVSKGARFERLDQQVIDEDRPASPRTNPSEAKP